MSDRDLDCRVARLMGWQDVHQIVVTGKYYGRPPGGTSTEIPLFSEGEYGAVIRWLQLGGSTVTITYPASPQPWMKACEVRLKAADGSDPIFGPWMYGETVGGIICLAALLYGRETGRDETQIEEPLTNA